MKRFFYTYQDQTLYAGVEHFTEGLYNRFRIYTTMETFVIARANNGKVIWLQSDGYPLPYDFIQAVGEGLEAAGIY